MDSVEMTGGLIAVHHHFEKSTDEQRELNDSQPEARWALPKGWADQCF